MLTDSILEILSMLHNQITNINLFDIFVYPNERNKLETPWLLRSFVWVRVHVCTRMARAPYEQGYRPFLLAQPEATRSASLRFPSTILLLGEHKPGPRHRANLTTSFIPTAALSVRWKIRVSTVSHVSTGSNESFNDRVFSLSSPSGFSFESWPRVGTGQMRETVVREMRQRDLS